MYLIFTNGRFKLFNFLNCLCACRDIIIEYSSKIMALGNTIFELFSEALGLDPSYLKELNCLEALYVQGHYYPSCPEPELTMGASKHTDPGFMAIVLQDQLGGLQVLHENQWVNVSPVHGALVVNVGDLLQVCIELVLYNFLVVICFISEIYCHYLFLFYKVCLSRIKKLSFY